MAAQTSDLIFKNLEDLTKWKEYKMNKIIYRFYLEQVKLIESNDLSNVVDKFKQIEEILKNKDNELKKLTERYNWYSERMSVFSKTLSYKTFNAYYDKDKIKPAFSFGDIQSNASPGAGAAGSSAGAAGPCADAAGPSFEKPFNFSNTTGGNFGSTSVPSFSFYGRGGGVGRGRGRGTTFQQRIESPIFSMYPPKEHLPKKPETNEDDSEVKKPETRSAAKKK